jgi:hypothetical protein
MPLNNIKKSENCQISYHGKRSSCVQPECEILNAVTKEIAEGNSLVPGSAGICKPKNVSYPLKCSSVHVILFDIILTGGQTSINKEINN